MYLSPLNLSLNINVCVFQLGATVWIRLKLHSHWPVSAVWLYSGMSCNIFVINIKWMALWSHSIVCAIVSEHCHNHTVLLTGTKLKINTVTAAADVLWRADKSICES